MAQSEATIPTLDASQSPRAPTPSSNTKPELHSSDAVGQIPSEESSPPKDFRFWLIILSLCLATILSAIDLTAVSTALPTIAADLNTAEFAWIGSSYALTSTAFLPWTGGLSNIFGRRAIVLGSIALFALGSGLCGGATNIDMMIAGRAVQGVGGGGILAATEIVIADLVPLKERGVYQGIFGAVWALASAIGPPIGGALAESNWRWLFYMNLPLCALAAVVCAIFMNLRVPEGTLREKVARIDFIGNAIAIAATTSTVIALTWAGVVYSWGSYHILVPLILGLAGLVAFVVYEKMIPREPTVPFDIISNWTAIMGYLQTFLHGIIVMAIVYYMPAFLQGVHGESPIKSGVSLFNLSFSIAPAGIVAGAVITITGNYWIISQIGWILLIVGLAAMTTIDAASSRAFYEGVPVLAGLGAGILFTAPTFPILAPTRPSRNAEALSFLVFMRSFGQVFGVTIGATILQNELLQRLPGAYKASLGQGGGELAYAAIATIRTLEEPLRSTVRSAFADSVAVIWTVMAPLAGVGLIAALVMKSLPLTIAMDDRFGIDRDDKRASSMNKAEEAA